MIEYRVMDLDKRKKIIILIAATAFFIAGIFFWKSRGAMNGKDTSKSSEEVTLTETPEPTEEPEFKIEDFTIKILNGSGKAGISGELQKELEEKGYKVETTGNADNYDYKTTILQSKESVPEKFIDELKDLLSDKYTSVETEVLGSDEDTDVVIIIGGQQVKETPAPTQSAQATVAPTTASSPTSTPTVAPSSTPTP